MTGARKSSSAPRPSTTTAPACMPRVSATATPCTWATSTPRAPASRSGTSTNRATSWAPTCARPATAHGSSPRLTTTAVEGPGRGVAADIWSGNAGAEYWGAGPNMTFLRNASGANIGRNPGSANHLAWWDADTVRELVDGNHVDKYGTGGDTRLLTADGTTTNNGTKSTPALSGDLFGDWREEVIWRTTNNSALRIYTTTQRGDQPHLHAAARSAVPRGDRLAEHRVQPAAASGLLHRRQHADAADAEHRHRGWHAAGSAAGHADVPGGSGIVGRRHREREHATAGSSAAATSTPRRAAASRRVNNVDGRGGGSHDDAHPLCAGRDRQPHRAACW